MQFTAPGIVELVKCEPMPLRPGSARVRTTYSGISTGTELTAYRGSNPYVRKNWDADRRIFTSEANGMTYPLLGWGYSEVGEVTEVAEDVRSLRPGDTVYGIWGHRSDAVVAADKLTVILGDITPLHGIFGRVGAVALNAVLGADLHLGEHVAIFGQGVIGLLATRLARLNGAVVLAVDGHEHRLELARTMGANHTVRASSPGGAGEALRSVTGDVGADVAIELSGSYRALHEAVRSVGPDGRVIAAGFYQGAAEHLNLGEEFHHNRVQIIASQIGNTPAVLGPRWNQARLVQVFMDQIANGALDPAPLISDVMSAERVAEAFHALETADPQTLQVVLQFSGDSA